MIKTASELLAAFIAKERENAESFSMPHMPTLGRAYEAIAMHGIDQQFVLPPNLDLRVVSGFIKGIPNEIDAMLVCGEGTRYGLTDQYFYPARQVLCVLEVKKTLSKSALKDGLSHLAGILRHCLKDFSDRFDSDENLDFRQSRFSFEQLTGRIGPQNDQAVDDLPDHDRVLYGLLARQIYAPVTVLLGFDGYVTEHGLRSAMLDIMEGLVGSNSDASPELLPSLVTAGAFSLIKCTGQPYLIAGPHDGFVILASARHNVARILLELLWTKISMVCDVRMPFGPDLDFESLKELVVARGVSRDGQHGFVMAAHEYSEEKLLRSDITEWEPTKLSAAAVHLAELLSFRQGGLQLDASLAEHIQMEHQVNLDAAVQELVNTQTYCRSKSELRAIGKGASIASLEDGSGYADRYPDRLQIWCEKNGLDVTFMSHFLVD